MTRLIVASLFCALGASFVAAAEFVGAPKPPTLTHPSPLTGQEQRASFSLPPGFQMELVASEPEVEKVVAINFDHAGRLWAITATEYPIDGNEQPEEAKQLYLKGGKDRVVVFDNIAGTKLKGRNFAEGLAIPLGILPLSSNKAIVAQGPEIFTLTDTNNDGRADSKEVLLSGFGIQDSHLMPHGLVRGPGDWVYFAQGAFNYSQVKTREGTVVQFDQCKVGRFKLDGSQFETVGWGLNNIWGFVISRHGEMFAQEANDLGYPMVPFKIGVNYPGIGMHKARPYAPWEPPLANDFQMGGTGLSGLALSEGDNGFGGAYRDIFFLANPITSKLQAIRATREGSSVKLTKLPDFALTEDTWFRPVAMQFGPDGCLYVVDWYNKIISHNEVPRSHPERDKTRTRIWRVRANGSGGVIANLEKASAAELLTHLKSQNAWAGNGAWQRIVDLKLSSSGPELRTLALNASAEPEVRLRALWALEGLKLLNSALLQPLLADSNRNLRREAIRAIQSSDWAPAQTAQFLRPAITDADPAVRAEIVRTLTKASGSPEVVALLCDMTEPPLDGPTILAQQGGGPILIGAGSERAFERYLIRVGFEKHRTLLGEALSKPNIKPEALTLAAVTLGDESAAKLLARIAPTLQRAVSEEETLLLAAHVKDGAVRAAFASLLADKKTQHRVVDQLWSARDRIDLKPLQEFIRPALATYDTTSTSDRPRVAELAGAFQVEEIRPRIEQWLTASTVEAEKLRFIRALAQYPAANPQVFFATARAARSSNLQLEAVSALGKQKSDEAAKLLVELWPDLALLPRHKAIESLASSPAGSQVFVDAIKTGAIESDDLDSYAVEKLASALPNEPRVRALSSKLAGSVQVLRLSGAGADQIPTGHSFVGPFTMEAWVRMEEGINNQDAIAGSGDWDMNFHDQKLRLYAGAELADVLVASKPVSPNTWTHFAITRDAEGMLKMFVNGALGASGSRPLKRDLPAVVIGQSMAVGGLAGEITEFRIWNVARSNDEILSTANLTFTSATKPAGLVMVFPGDKAALGGVARVDRSSDVPPLLSPDQAKEVEAKFTTYRRLADQSGDMHKGRELFSQACASCHSVGGQGGQIGPALNGAAALGLESLLRSIIAPNAMMESGYRRFHVERTDGEPVEGFLVSEKEGQLIVRPVAGEDIRIPVGQVKRSYYSRMSIMPEGLLESLSQEQAKDLLTYLKQLK